MKALKQFSKLKSKIECFRTFVSTFTAAICILLFPLVSLAHGENEGADACQKTSSSVSAGLGTLCTKEPSCTIVGQTHMLVWKSRAPENIVLVCIHGLGLCARAYQPLARDFSEAGIDGFAVNVRGFGPDRDKPGHEKLDPLATIADVKELLTRIRAERPTCRIFLLGESLGGALALQIAAENPELIDGLVCSAPAWKIYGLRRDIATGVAELASFRRAYPGPLSKGVIHQATSDPELAQHWLSDDSHKMRLSFSEGRKFLSYISATDRSAKKLIKPVLFVQGLNDHLVSPDAVAKLFSAVRSTNKTSVIDAKGEHLVLEEGRCSPALSEKIIAWIKENAAFDNLFEHKVLILNEQALSRQESKKLSEVKRTAQN